MLIRIFSAVISVFLFFSAGVVSPACADTSAGGDAGDDSSIRFTETSKGTVLDNTTGLMWLKNADMFSVLLPWQVAKEYITEMNEGTRENFGYTDWRLPSLNEISSLIDVNRSYPALIPGNPFVNVRNDYYWSSTGGINIVGYAWVADIGSGNVKLDYISYCNFHAVWPVRTTERARDNDLSAIVLKTIPSKPGLKAEDLMCEDNVKTKSLLPPAGVSVTAVSPNEVVLTWQPPADKESIAWYNIYREGKFLKSSPALSASFGGLEQDTEYCYTVTSYSDAGIESEETGPVCASTWSLSAKGTIWALGVNNYGQVGDGSQSDRQTLVITSDISDVLKVAAGVEHSVALKSDGTVWAWGRNQRGQLGDGTTDDHLNPVQVEGISDFVEVDAGWYHTVALKSDGTVWTWGRNYYGQLGNGTNADSKVPVKVKGLSDVKKISAGWYHTLALRKDGTVWAWGWNRKGQLGIGEGMSVNRPEQVADLNGIVDITAGMYHSAALRSNGKLLTWGSNEYGQLGIGNELDSLLPVEVKGLLDVSMVSAGMYFTVALQSDGKVWSWGRNDFGQLGNLTSYGVSGPIKVDGVGGVKKVAAGAQHVVVLLDNGTVWTWGWNYGREEKKSLPAQLSGMRGISDIDAGNNFTLTLKGE